MDAAQSDTAAQLGLNGRVPFAPGSLFENPLPKADVILMGHILHGWDLDTKKALIRKAYEALPAAAPTSSMKQSSTTTAARTRSAR